ncbi:hypothetical protein AWJ20_1244 [Sugiyamaella lignohabitans]|uniref:F-box domain-containing protein n=1 Tax=Sugiyamaella lignohabitans TaxID=796027 RepID=A0A161HVC4_9ASCO|nr:uncharacterized protein AWJ20_1244 [Sugiyamaella lignohabitans]ANB12966.1 hypothetical protein AWJ20_1244 [Sugiyamaella lignohabitans]
MTVTILDIPPEVLVNILFMLDIKSYHAVRQTNGALRRLATQRKVEVVMLNRFVQEQIVHLDRGEADYHGYTDPTTLADIRSKEWKTGEHPIDDTLISGTTDNQALDKSYLALSRELFIGLDVYPKHKIFTPKIDLRSRDQKDQGTYDQNVGNSQLSPSKEFYSLDGTKLVLVTLVYPINAVRHYQIAIYDLSKGAPRLETLCPIPHDNIPSCLSVSAEGRYIALQVDSGSVNVYDRYDSKTKGFLVDSLGKSIFTQIYPSIIKDLHISAGGEILFLRFSRLGGLILVNLDTNEEMDIGHYRLDLDLGLHHTDRVLTVSSRIGETVVFGRATDFNKERPRNLWEYYKVLLSQEVSTCIPLTHAIPLNAENTFIGVPNHKVGLCIGYDPDYSSYVTSFESFSTDNERRSIKPDGGPTHSVAGEGPDNKDNSESESESESDDESEVGSQRDDAGTARLCKIPMTDEGPKIWALSPDTSRVAFVRNPAIPVSSIVLVSLNAHLLKKFSFNPDEPEIYKEVQWRTIINVEQKPIFDLRFVDRDHFLVRHEDMIVIYEISTTTEATSYSKIEPTGKVTYIA